MPEPTALETGSQRTERLCAPGDLASGEARRFDVAGLRVALVRIGDDYYAIGDRCSHEDFSLADGEVWTGGVRDRVRQARVDLRPTNR